MKLFKFIQEITTDKSVAIPPLFHVLLRSGSFSFKNTYDSNFAKFANIGPLIQEFPLI